MMLTRSDKLPRQFRCPGKGGEHIVLLRVLLGFGGGEFTVNVRPALGASVVISGAAVNAAQCPMTVSAFEKPFQRIRLRRPFFPPRSLPDDLLHPVKIRLADDGDW